MMIRSTLVFFLTTASLAAGSAAVSAEPKCKSGTVYSADLRKCVAIARPDKTEKPLGSY